MDMTLLLLLMVGFITGFLGALLGLGGGMIVIPFLHLYLGYSMDQSVLTSLFCVVTTSSGVIVHKFESAKIQMNQVVRVELFALLGGVSSASWAVYLDETWVVKIFSVIMFIIAGLLLGSLLTQKKEPSPSVSLNPRIVSLSLIGIAYVTGLLAGLLGIGGGAFIVPALNLIGKVPIVVATVMSSYIMGLTAVGAICVYWMKIEPDYLSIAMVVLGLLVGIRLEAFANIKSPKVIKIIFIGLVMMVGIKMWLK